jgi:D-proline reductase (dithiol) PrdB
MTVSDEPIRYMERTREYYRALGYRRDYVWAHFTEVPFARLARPLAHSRIALVTTARPLGLANRNARGIRRVWSRAVEPPPESLFTDHVAWDKASTHTRDRGSYLPIEVASALAAEGLVAGLAARFHGVPTEYSQRKTTEEDAPEVLARVRADGADAALLCPL